MKLERYDFQEVESRPSDFVAIVRHTCICGPAFESNGELWQPRAPSCMVHTPTAERQYAPQFKFGANSRTVGRSHS